MGKTHTDPSASDYLRLLGSEDAETGPRGVQAIFQGDAETGPRGVWIKWKDHTKKQNRRVPDDEPGKDFVDIEMIPEKVEGEEGYEEQQKMKRNGLLKKRCDACWTGFQLENMDSLVKGVMKDYVVYWNLS